MNRRFTSAGAKIIQWTCTGNPNQRWIVTPLNGGHTITSAKAKFLLTAASTADGALITQRAASGTALQKWTIG